MELCSKNALPWSLASPPNSNSTNSNQLHLSSAAFKIFMGLSHASSPVLVPSKPVKAVWPPVLVILGSALASKSNLDWKYISLVVAEPTHLKNTSQLWSSPQFSGWKIQKNRWQNPPPSIIFHAHVQWCLTIEILYAGICLLLQDVFGQCHMPDCCLGLQCT